MPGTSDAVVTAVTLDHRPPAVAVVNAADAMLSHSVHILLSLVKPVSATANKRKKAAAMEQKYGPIEVNLSTGFDGAWAELAQLIDQPADVFDFTSAEWRFMKPANSARYPLRDASAFSFLAKQVHSRATLKTPKNADILINVKLRPVQQGQVCFSQFYYVRLSNIDDTGLRS